MSTLKTDTLSNAAGTKSVPVATVVDGSAKAWVNFNGAGTVAIRASFNVSSITDNGVGDYTVNFTTAMPDVNYAPVFIHSCRDRTAYNDRQLYVQGETFSTTQLRLWNQNNGSSWDNQHVVLAIFR